MFFWSVLIFVDILVLVTFYVCLTLCVTVAVAIFAHSGCAQLYVLGDMTVCSEALGVVGKLLSFLGGGTYIQEGVCGHHYLLTCNVFTTSLKGQGVLTGVAGFLASFFSFNLLVESAVLHERARWQRHRME